MNRDRIVESVGVRIQRVTEATDSAGPTIEAQLITAGMSLNRRFYPEEVLRKAAPLYEGKKVMLDHASFLEPESVRNIAAVIAEARWDRQAKAITGTIRPSTQLESGKTLLDLARAQVAYREDGTLADEEHLFGFSHVALITGTPIEPDEDDQTDGEELEPYLRVDAIEEVMSVDAVAFPAAGGAMSDLSEARKGELIGMLRESGVLPPPDPKPNVEPPPETGRRKVTIMSKNKSRQFDTSGIVVTIEGVDRQQIEPALQSAAQEGHDAATAEAQERISALEADKARVEGERDAAQAKLQQYEEREAAQQRMEAIEQLMVEKGIPEVARPTLKKRVEGMEEKAAQAVVNAYAEGLSQRLEEAPSESDVPPSEQDANTDPHKQAENVGEAFFKQHSHMAGQADDAAGGDAN